MLITLRGKRVKLVVCRNVCGRNSKDVVLSFTLTLVSGRWSETCE